MTHCNSLVTHWQLTSRLGLNCRESDMRFERCKQFAVSTNHISTCRGISEITQLERQTCGFPNWQTNPLDPLRSVALEITVAFISRGIFSDPHSEFAHPLAYTLAHNLVHILADTLPNTLAHPLAYTLAHNLVYTLVHPLLYSLWFTHWPTLSRSPTGPLNLPQIISRIIIARLF